MRPHRLQRSSRRLGRGRLHHGTRHTTSRPAARAARSPRKRRRSSTCCSTSPRASGRTRTSHRPHCTPLTACPAGYTCGSYPNGCGTGNITCGTCPGTASCVDGQCVCVRPADDVPRGRDVRGVPGRLRRDHRVRNLLLGLVHQRYVRDRVRAADMRLAAHRVRARRRRVREHPPALRHVRSGPVLHRRRLRHGSVQHGLVRDPRSLVRTCRQRLRRHAELRNVHRDRPDLRRWRHPRRLRRGRREPLRPRTCAGQGIECGPAGDGCGNLIASCGTCPTGQTCGGGGTPGVCGAPNCTPTTCGSLQCGDTGRRLRRRRSAAAPARAPETCGGGGTTGVCGERRRERCVPRPADRLNVRPSGRRLRRHRSTAARAPRPQTCGGGGTPGTCGGADLHPDDVRGARLNCGPAGDGCGGTLDCGTCTAPETCGGGGTPGVCGQSGCHRRTTCTCGSAPAAGQTGDGCGNLLNCGTCTPPADLRRRRRSRANAAHRPARRRRARASASPAGRSADGCGGYDQLRHVHSPRDVRRRRHGEPVRLAELHAHDVHAGRRELRPRGRRLRRDDPVRDLHRPRYVRGGWGHQRLRHRRREVVPRRGLPRVVLASPLV